MLYDSTKFISASIDEVFKTIGEAVLIVVVVIFLFLGSLRTVLIPVVTIPLSLIGVCFVLYAFGYSLNTLTLLAMVLAIGLVVDDAIVVVENIHRHIEDGMKPMDAAITGMREITGAVVAMTITLAAVYAPIGFATGLTGSLFREFAVTLAGAVIISGFCAITISPMMSARLLRHGSGRLQGFIDRTFQRVASWYRRRLTSTLKYRPVTLMIAAAVLATAIFLVMHTSTELAPEEDQGALFSIVNGPRYATSDYVKLYTDQMDRLTRDAPELATRFQIAGAPAFNQAFAIWTLKPWNERTRSQAQIQQEFQGLINANVAGVEAFLFAPADAAGHRRRPPDPVRRAEHGEPRPRLRDRRRDPPAGARLGQVHRRAELDVLRHAEHPPPHRPQQGGRARRLGARYRHDARRHGRRRLGLQVRSRQPQLRHHPAGAAELPAEPGGAAEILRARRGRHGGAALLGGDHRHAAPRRRRSSSSTSSTRRPSRRCRCRA